MYIEKKIIKSISSALEVASEMNDESSWNNFDIKYNKPFGIWYRGQSKYKTLEPSIFRKKTGVYDETSLYHHFILKNPKYRLDHLTTFDWLTLMQHYDIPTRLLDWTESILTGLYFTIRDSSKDNEDGFLFVLNARALNQISDFQVKDHVGIHIPESFNVVIRAQLATHRYLDHSFLDLKEVLDSDKADLPKYFHKCGSDYIMTSQKIQLPVAVYPYRKNERIHVQNGVFTIHGGKFYTPKAKLTNRIKAPIHLNEMVDSSSFLKIFKINKNHKPRIRHELELLNINESSLFPEIDKQAIYMKQLWSFRNEYERGNGVTH